MAFDDDSHVEIKPTVIRLDELSIPGIDLQRVMTKIIIKLDLPADLMQRSQGILHECRPGILVGQTKGMIRRAPESMQCMDRDTLQPHFRQAIHQVGFALVPAQNTDGFAIRHRAELTNIIRFYLRIEITKHRQRHVNDAFFKTGRIPTPVPVAVNVQSFKAQHGNRARFDTAQIGTGILGRQRQAGRQFNQGVSDKSGLDSGKRRQGKQTRDDIRSDRHIQRANQVFFQINKPGRL